MLPLGHLGAAYLLYFGYAVVQSRRLPARWALLPVAIGSQLPDVIDKPLSYWQVLPSGRSVGHSVFTFLIVCLVVWQVTGRLRGRWPADSWQEHLRATIPVAFPIAYLSHLIGDSYTHFLAGNFWDARFLLYPLYVVPYPVDTEVAPWTRLLAIYGNMETHPQGALLLVALLVFVGIRFWKRWKRFRATEPDT